MERTALCLIVLLILNLMVVNANELVRDNKKGGKNVDGLTGLDGKVYFS